MRPGTDETDSTPGCSPVQGAAETGIHARVLSALQCREHLRPVIVPGSRGRVLSSESCSGCSGLDNGRGTGGRSDLTVPGAAGITGGRSGLTVPGAAGDHWRPITPGE